MKVEHIAFNVADTEGMSRWYCEHLGMKVVRRMTPAIFLADETGHGILEIYTKPPDQVPDYAAMDPLQLHLAFASSDLQTDSEVLIKAGAAPAGEAFDPDTGYGVLFLKDPWGFTIQLVNREQKLL